MDSFLLLIFLVGFGVAAVTFWPSALFFLFTTSCRWVLPDYYYGLSALIIMLIITVDWPYTPTSLTIIAYCFLLLHSGYFSALSSWGVREMLIASISSVAYFVAGFFWLRQKWWLYLCESRNEYALKNLRPGDERQFFLDRLRELYPHFLYWPLSLVKAIFTDLGYRVFRAVAERYSGRFVSMITERREQIKKS